ncbi:hypothetical protein pb186bvf_020572 [Paramecium bursaria]
MQKTKINKNYNKLQIKDKGCSQIYIQQHQQCKYIEFDEIYDNKLFVNLDLNQWISLDQLIELHKFSQLSSLIVLKIVGKVIEYVYKMNECQLYVGIMKGKQQHLENIWIAYQALNQIDSINDIQIIFIDLSSVIIKNRFLFSILSQWLTENNIEDENLKTILSDYKEQDLEVLYQYIESMIFIRQKEIIEDSRVRIVHDSSTFIRLTSEIEYLQQNYMQFKDFFLTILSNELNINLNQYIQQLDSIIIEDSIQILDDLQIQHGLFELNNYLLLKISFDFIIPKLQMSKYQLYLLCNGLIYFTFDENQFKESIKQQQALYHIQLEQFHNRIRNNIELFCKNANINIDFQELIIQQFRENNFGNAVIFVENLLIQQLSDKILDIREEKFQMLTTRDYRARDLEFMKLIYIKPSSAYYYKLKKKYIDQLYFSQLLKYGQFKNQRQIQQPLIYELSILYIQKYRIKRAQNYGDCLQNMQAIK